MHNPLEPPLRQLEQHINRLKPLLLAQMGAVALDFVHENFDMQGFQGAVFQPWAPRQSRDKKRPGRAILVDSAHLKNANRIVRQGVEDIVIGNNMPYARIHNEGGTIHHPARTGTLAFRFKDKGYNRRVFAGTQTAGQRKKITSMWRGDIGAHDTQMTQRRFMGDSPVLRKRCKATITKTITKDFKLSKR